MKKKIADQPNLSKPEDASPRRMRADARRKMDSLLQAAMEVFQKSGVDAPVREIAERAGVGLGTVYRHFPQRSDLIKAVFQTRVDACADAADVLASEYEPGEALARWMQRFVDFISTKRGLAAALHSGDPAYSALPGYFNTRLLPALETLLDAAVAAGEVRPGIEAVDLLRAVATLCRGPHDEEPVYARRMVELLVDGLRYGASTQTNTLPETRRRRSNSAGKTASRSSSKGQAGSQALSSPSGICCSIWPAQEQVQKSKGR